MKKIFGSIALTCYALGSFAQNHLRFAPEISATYATINQKTDGYTRENTYQLGVKLGVIAEYEINPNLYFQPGIALALNQGTKTNWDYFYKTGAGLPTSIHDKRQYNVHYVQIPLNLVYKFGKDPDYSRFFVSAGAYLGIAFAGQFTQNYTDVLNGISIEKNYDYTLPFGNSRTKDKLRAYDFGVNAQIGYQIANGAYIKGGYTYGLANIMPSGNGQNKMNNHGANLTIGYFIP